MQTLEQHLQPYAFQEYDSDGNTDEKHQMFYIDDVLKAAKEWLQEHTPQRDYNNIAEEYRQTLIKELEQK